MLGVAAASCAACSTVLGVDDLPAKKTPPPSYCQTLPTPVTFCRDFDDGAPYDADVDFWEATPPNAVIRVDNQNSKSAPASLFSEVTKTADEVRRAYISRQFDAPATDIRLAFDLLIEEAPTAPVNAIVASLGFGSNTPDEHGLAVNVTSTSAYLEEHVGKDQYEQYEFSIQPRLGTWSRFEIHLQTTTRHVTAWIDGHQTADTTLQGTWHAAPLFFSVGSFWVTANGTSVRLRHDNVVLDLK